MQERKENKTKQQIYLYKKTVSFILVANDKKKINKKKKKREKMKDNN